MAEVARLTKSGEFKIIGELNERLPAITTGLVAHFPFDGVTESLYGLNLDNDPNGVTGWAQGASSIVNGAFVFTYGSYTAKANWDFYKTYTGLISNETYEWSAEIISTTISNLIICRNNTADWNIGVVKNDMYVSDSKRISLRWTQGATDTLANLHLGACGRTDSSGLIQGGGSLKLGNIRLCRIIKPTTNTTNTLTYDGIAVEEATTNLYTQVPFAAIYNNYGVPASKVTLPNEKYLGQIIERVTMTPTAENVGGFQTELWSHGVYGNSITFAANTLYVVSVYWRPVSHSDTQVGLTASNTGSWTDLVTINLPNGWKRSIATRSSVATAQSDSMFFSFRSPSIVLGESHIMDWSCPQLESGKNFATSYVNGSRSVGGILNIPFPPNLVQEGTLVWKLSNIASSNYNRSLGYQWSPTGSGAGHFGVKLNSANTLTVAYANSDIATSGIISDLNKHIVVWRYKNNNTQSLFLDGVKVYEGAVGAQDDLNRKFDVFPIGLTGWTYNNEQLNGVINSFSIYDRTLTDEEILTLSKDVSLLINSAGNLKTPKLIERPKFIPSDAIYLPLDNKSTDEYGVRLPTIDTNIAYENSMAWIGQTTTNIFRQSNVDNDFDVRGSGLITVKKYMGDCVEYEYQYNQNLTWTYHGQTMVLVSGNQYLASMDVFISLDANIPATGNTFVANIEGGLACSFYYDNTKKGQWQHLEILVTATTTSANLYLYPCTNATPATTGFLRFRNVQCEQRNFRTPFVNGTRGDGTLSIPTSNLLRANSTIIISYIAKTNISNTIISNANVGPWWGVYHNGDGTIYMHEGSGGASVLSNKSTVLNKVTQLAITWDATNQYLYIDGVLAATIATNGTANAASIPNLYIGYGWTRGNAFFKDLIIVKRTLSATEIASIYNASLTININSLQIKNNITEGSII